MKRMKGITMIMAGAGMLLLASSASAGDLCVNCHTMHNSEDGVAVDPSSSPGPGNKQLLKFSTCLACHTGTNTAVAPAQYHFVLDDSADPELAGTMLAGGNFYWTEQGDSAANDNLAHNLTGLTNNADQNNSQVAPGGGPDLSGGFTCAGTTGCHGVLTQADEFLSLNGAHHANTGGQITAPTAGSPGTAYRFLDGIAGFEDADREFVVTAAGHNEYMGEARASDAPNLTTTVSYLCAQCHEDFHNNTGGDALSTGGTMASPWWRHPTDYEMDLSGGKGADYSGYLTYDPVAPVARESIPAASSATVDNTVAGQHAIVMCLSCHRAHGSAYGDILRWDYVNSVGGAECISEIGDGTSTCGCFACHTGKDD